MRQAVIDVGSNSVLLLISEWKDGTWEPIYESSAVTGLGENTKATGLLSEAGMTRTLAAIKAAFDLAHEHGVNEVKAGVTMAARIANNSSDFLARAALQSTPVEILSGEREADLGFLAVASDTAFNEFQRVSIIDVGGQSTELVTADRDGHSWKVRYRKSFSIGTLALRGGILREEVPSGLDILRASREIDELIGLAYRPHEGGTAVALGATGTNLITIRDQMLEWDPHKVHGQVLLYEEVSKSVSWLCGMSDAERAAVPGMEKGREKSIHLGALILERFLYALRVEKCFVSVRGWRHAWLEEMGSQS